MRTKLVLSLIIGSVIFLVGFGYRNVSSISKQAQLKELDSAKDQGSVAWYVRKAKLTGESEIAIPGLTRCPPEVGDLNDALSKFRVVLAEPVERFTKVDTVGLVTWYKFVILDDFSSNQFKSPQGCSNCGNSSGDISYLPKELLPLKEGEIVVPHIGGELLIDGIRVVQPSGILIDFSTGLKIENYQLLSRKTYDEPKAYKRVLNPRQFLLFLSMSNSSKVGSLSLLERGIFSHSPEGELEAVENLPDPIKKQLDELQINSLEKLKTYSQRMK
jgi:hypothetical protein